MFTPCGALDSLEVFLVYLVSWSCGLRSTYSTVQYSAVQYSGVPQYSRVQCSAVQWNATVQQVQCSATEQYITEQYSTVPQISTLYPAGQQDSGELCCILLCRNPLCCAVLCCIFIVHNNSWKIVGRWGVKSESTENSPPQYHIWSYFW